MLATVVVMTGPCGVVITDVADRVEAGQLGR